MYSSRETKIVNFICVGLVFLSGVLRLGLKGRDISCSSFICTLFTAAIFLWIMQLKRRLIQPDVRKSLIIAAGFMIFYMVIRTLKYDFFPVTHPLSRYMWYLYYVPMILIPLQMFFPVLYIGRSSERPISCRWKLLYIPAIVLISGILTNDLHQLAFRFPKGLSGWDDTYIIRGPFYYAAMVWIAVLFTVILVIALKKCAVPVNRKKIWLPMLPLLFGLLYMVLTILNTANILTEMFKVPEIGCFIFAAFMECLICVHLFPSNDSYGDFWNASSIGAGIMDEAGNFCYRSMNSILVTPQQVMDAEAHMVFLENGNLTLQSHKIAEGYGYWTRDISRLNILHRKLQELGDVLAEEKAMLKAENLMKEKRVRIRQREMIYAGIAREVFPQLEQISKILENLPQEEQEFEKEMKYACILNTYIKRRCNLELLMRQNRQISSRELFVSIKESLDAVSFFGCMAHVFCNGETVILGERLVFVYELFEHALETAIPGAGAVLVSLDVSAESLDFHMEISTPETVLSEDIFRESVKKLGGELHMENEPQTEYIDLHLPTGGEEI